MRPILPFDLGVDETYVGLVDQGRRLQRVSLGFPSHVTGGQSPQFVVDEGEKVVEGFGVATSPIQ